MSEQSASQRLAGIDQGRRPLDLAEGIVMTLRRTDPSSAFAEMVSVAAEYGVTVLALARALISLVGGPAGFSCDARARHAALQRWGPALQ
jgi:AmiR/NasT family two-component response regulator